MSLIICNECGKEFSDKALECPNCGCPTASMVDVVSNNKGLFPNKISQKCCPKCGSTDIRFDKIAQGEKGKGRSEVRKKSIVTRTGNKLGRMGMIFATGGLWALTPKKSKYSEKKKEKSTIQYQKVAICQNCGYDWKVK